MAQIGAAEIGCESREERGRRSGSRHKEDVNQNSASFFK